MRTFQAISKELRLLGASKHVISCREARALPKILHRDETILAFLYGVFEAGAYALMVSTNERVLYINKTPGNLVVDDIPYDMVASVEFSSGLVWGKVKVFSRSRVYVFSFVKKSYVEPFVGVIEELMHKRRPPLPDNK